MDSKVIIFYIIFFVVAIVLKLYLASVGRGIAREKGFEEGKWFHICFWFSAVGYLLVVALPDLKARRLQDETNRLLKRIADGHGVDTDETTAEPQSVVAAFLAKH